MINFQIDYAEGAHPTIMSALMQTNMLQTPGYGTDYYCHQAKEYIQTYLNPTKCDIHFLMGGTQTNLTFISHVLRPYEAVLSPSTGHIAFNETGSIEATGHKVIEIPSIDGKVTLEALQKIVAAHNTVHMLKPKLLYLSNPTELGTLYSKQELERLSHFCQDHQLYLYLDGARLASALTAPSNTLQLSDYAHLTDAFYIGGTKNGALFGEALVISNPLLQDCFRFSMKQKGALLAKGRLLGIQFAELFQNQLYFKIGQEANSMAQLLKEGLSTLNFPFLVDSDTNQLFPIFPNSLIDYLHQRFTFLVWDTYDESHSIIRLITSFSTTRQDIYEFLSSIIQFQEKDALQR